MCVVMPFFWVLLSHYLTDETQKHLLIYRLLNPSHLLICLKTINIKCLIARIKPVYLSHHLFCLLDPRYHNQLRFLYNQAKVKNSCLLTGSTGMTTLASSSDPTLSSMSICLAQIAFKKRFIRSFRA